MHGLKDLKYFEEWSSECAPYDPPQKAMQILGGNQWKDVYEYMDQLGVLVVGTLSPFLGAAGGSL